MKTHTIDATNKILGRLATEVAVLLRGKNKPEFVNYMDKGDKVIIINTDKIKVTGKKTEDKIYYWHSGYPGGIKERNFADFMERDSREVIRRAVYGMLPKNRLRDKVIKKLELYKKGEIKTKKRNKDL
ncbi:MAG: 50S ribosomal protein L13 [bacterium]